MRVATALKYIELKTGYNDNGPAWIGRVLHSRTKRTVYFNGRALHRIKHGWSCWNYLDAETRERYWVSGVKKDGEDRHWAGSGKVLVERAALAEYLSFRGILKLDPSRYEVTDSIVQTDIEKITRIANEKSAPIDWETFKRRFPWL